MKKLLVILHVYYHPQVDYFLSKLRNINGCDFDLLVTWSTPDPATEAKFRAFKPDCRFYQVPNRGFDVWPFIDAVKNAVDLDAYDYILKLHTKNANLVTNRVNGINLKNYRWRSLLVNAILKSPRQFSRALSKLDSSPKAGMVCSYELLKKTSNGLAEDLVILDNELERIGLQSKDRHFCAGTMFLCRAEPLKFLKTVDLSADDFDTHSASHSRGTKAHVWERVLSFVITSAGYRIKPIVSDIPTAIGSTISRYVTPALEWLFALKRIGVDEKKYLVIFGIHICLSSDKPEQK